MRNARAFSPPRVDSCQPGRARCVGALAVDGHSPWHVKPNNTIGALGQRLAPPEIDSLGDPARRRRNACDFDATSTEVTLQTCTGIVCDRIELVDGHAQIAAESRGERRL